MTDHEKEHEKEMQYQSDEFVKDPIAFIKRWSFDPNTVPGFNPELRVIPTHIMLRVMKAYMSKYETRVNALKNKVRDKDVIIDRSMSLNIHLAKENEKLQEELFRLVREECEAPITEKRENLIDSLWGTLNMPRIRRRGKESNTRYTLYKKGNDKPLVIEGTAQECAHVMGVKENYIYVMLARNGGENGKWKLDKVTMG